MTPNEALQHVRTLVEASADVKDGGSARSRYVALWWSPKRVLAWLQMVRPTERAGTVGWARTTDLLFHRQAL